MRRRTLAVLLALTLSLLAGAPAGADGHDLPGALPAPPPGKPKYPRLDSQLNRLAAQAAQTGQGSDDVVTTSAPMYSGTSVAVTVRLSSGADAIAAFITEGGGIAANVGEDYIEAYVPPPLLAELSEFEGVLRVDTILPPLPSVISQGAAVHGAPAWNARGLTGAGVKVGIIDAGFEGFAALMGTELPSTVVARCYTSIAVFTSNLADCENGGNHGTNVSEIVFDFSPQATMYIANSISAGDLKSIAAWMVSQGVSVVNMSLVWTWDGPGDGSSPFSESPLKTVDQAVSGGITWLNGAGNHANASWFGTYSDTNGNGWIEFIGNQEVNQVVLAAGESITIQARWDDDWGNAALDFDLAIYDTSLTLLDISDNEQSGASGQNPFEVIGFTAPAAATYYLSIFHFAGAQPSWIQLNSFTQRPLSIPVAASSIMSPADSANPGLLAVGASFWATPSTIEGFSSQGPTPDGRTKPDIVGADRGATATNGPSGFSGTSAASPHVAGLAALVKQRFPSMTPFEVATYLKANALPRGTSPNNTWGFGLAQLPAIEPGAPTGVAATPGDGQASVTWDAPADGGSAITGYTVTASPGGATTAVGGASLSAVVSGLSNGTTYTFTVSATNAIGTSAASAPSTAVTPSGPPDPPTDVSALASNGQATVSWTAPASDGGSPITSYNVTSTPGSLTATVGGSTLSAVVTGLSNGTPYTFVVGASNAAGASAPSVPSATTTPKGPPPAPTNITAVPGNAEATVSWSAPASDGGTPILLYNIVSSPGGLTNAVSGTELTGLVTGLTNGTAYTFTVTALNALGAGPPSTSSPGVIPRTVPGAPTNVLAVAGDETASITWDAPASDGGSPILQYNVSSTPGGIGLSVASTTLAATVTGLTNFTAYTFTVTADNSVGTSQASDPSNSVTPPNDPPEFLFTNNESGDEGTVLTLQPVSFTDSDVADTHTAYVDWGDGTTSTAVVTESGGSGTISASHTYVNDGSYTATMTVTDSFGGVGADSFAIVVANVAPSVFAGGTRTTAGSSSVFPSVRYTDPGVLDTHSAEIDWGDGATSAGSVDAVRQTVHGGHTYSSPGQFIVTVTVTDDSGDSGSDILAIDVTSVPVAVSIPSLSTWGLLAMAVALGAAFVLRRRSLHHLMHGTNHS